MTTQSPTHRGTARPRKKLAGGRAGSGGRIVRLSEVIECADLMQLFEDFHDQGWAISIGRTSDGGAIAWGLLQGGPITKRYTPSREAVADLIAELEE